MASTQTLELGREAQRIASTVERLDRERVVARLWDRDASLWAEDAATQAAIRSRLGWLTIPRAMARHTQSLGAFAEEVFEAGFTHVLLLGMGGSSLFAEVCRNTFSASRRHADLAVLDTTDPTAIRLQKRRCAPERLAVIVSSKSGTTVEIQALAAYFYEQLAAAGGAPGNHCLAITDVGTPLEKQAEAWAFRRTFVHGPDSGMDVGGRFSALTYFGLVPAALLGVDLDTLLNRALEMLERCGPARAPAENPAAQLAAVVGSLAQAGREKLTLLTPPALQSFGTWLEQLIAESLGKSGTGVVPIFGEPVQAVSGDGQDRMVIELQLASEPDAAIERRVQALQALGVPVVRIQWRDRYDLGAEVVKWEVATALAGFVMGVNPFDEPNVKESKDRTNALLARYATEGRLEREEPWWCGEGIELCGAEPGAGGSLSQALAGFLTQQRPHDYCAILSFLPRTSKLDDAAQVMRMQLGRALGTATMLGFGPRYLHSTGQLFKGGPDAGMFFLLTAEETEDLAVPGAPYTFGVLKQAQALGDVQAMRQRSRRILHVHLGRDPAGGMSRLLGALDDALRQTRPRSIRS